MGKYGDILEKNTVVLWGGGGGVFGKYSGILGIYGGILGKYSGIFKIYCSIWGKYSGSVGKYVGILNTCCGILGKFSGYFGSLKIECHSKCNVTQNGMSLKIKRLSK